MKSTKFSGQGLLVKLSEGNKYIWIVLDTINWGEKYPHVDLSMGISKVSPGEYETACGKGYFECGPDEPEVLVLKLPGIDYFRFASANSFFYWDNASKSFKRIWISD